MATEKDINRHVTALIVVIDVYPQMIREMIVNNSPPKFVLMQIQNDEVFMNNITSQQKVMILKLDTEGYNALDLSCLYKVIRNRTLLPKPKQGWGQKPKAEDQSEADDVERMKKHRNDILHRPQGGLSESERNIFFQQSIEIATRVDRRIGSPKNGFESRIKEIKSDIARIVSPEKYLALIENLAECRDKLREKERPCVILYYANSIAKKIGNQHDQDIKKKDVTVALIKPDVVEAGKVDQMLEDIREAGIEILQHAERMLTEDEIRHKVYGYLENQVFFEDMVQFMTRSPSFVLALTRGKTGKNIIENFRDLIGPTDVEEAKTLKPDSLRAKYGHTSFRNAVHGSSSLETAKRDLQLFFPDFVAPDVEDKAAKLQTTLALVRPKAVVPYKDIILAKIRDSGFKVAMQKEIQMSTEMVEEFYKGHKGQDYYDHLIENMSSGPVLALGLIRENAIEGWRNMLGPKEVSIAQEKAPESLRAQFAVDDAINSLHGSDSEETAKKELQLLFPTEQTVAVIKPDAIRNKDEIVARIHEAGFRIAITTTTKLPEEVAKKFYVNCENKDYYIDLIEHMISGEACFIGMCREGAVEGWRSMIGPSDPTKAKKDSPDSIRATYGESILKNAVHGSSDPEHAKRSIKTIFGDRSSSCTIFLRDLDFDDEAVMQIKKKTLGNICTEDIKLIGIEQGSLILHVRIPDWCFMTTEILHERIHTFLHQFFLVASIPFMHGHIFTVVLAESDDLVSDNELTKAEDLDYLRENTLPILKLNVNIQDSVFQDEFVMHREVNRFFFRMYNAIDAHNIPVNGSAKEVLMLAANENGENFASNSATILNSQLRTEEQEASKMMTKEPVVNKIMTKEPVVSKMMTEEPVVSKMITEEPVVSKMMAEESMVSKMMARDLVISEERTEEPVVNKMVAEDLVLSEGRTKEPVVNKMVDEEQVCIEMMDKEPVVSKMMTERPVITERMTKEPEFREGNTEEPVVSKMMAVEPVLSVRVTEKPDVNERMTKELGVSERITQEPVVGKKMTAETVLSECFAEESVVSERMTEEPEVIETFVRMAQKAIEPVADLKMAQEPIVGEMESNYFRISKLFESAPRAVRIKFDDTFPPEILKETLHKNITILTNLKDNKSFSQIQWDSMFPRTGDPTSESFDIPLMIHLFRNLDKMVITNQFPPNTDVSVGADLSRIRRYRKDVPNSKDIVFTNAKFTAYWDEIEAAVIRLSGGILKEECDNLKTMAYNVAKRQTDRNNAQAAKRLAQIEDINDDVDRIEKIDHKQNSDDKKGLYNNL
ncbi:NME8 [Mytilus coruscus]|uniref:NME8 n=1 Tax=Mytilus coruscus TaxID=42192 RepID=A0A6J8F079_MYTCO|nr:NME8 [Mytilus coruscus]